MREEVLTIPKSKFCRTRSGRRRRCRAPPARYKKDLCASAAKTNASGSKWFVWTVALRVRMADFRVSIDVAKLGATCEEGARS